MNKIKRKIYIDKIIKVMKNDYPLFKNLKDYGFYDQLSKEELNYVFSGIFGKLVRIVGLSIIYDENGNIIYSEDSRGRWSKKKYDNENGKEIYYENYNGEWRKTKYDKNGNLTYTEHSDGVWYKYEYDKNGKEIYYENYNGEWRKTKYDDRGNIIYYENSDGVIKYNK